MKEIYDVVTKQSMFFDFKKRGEFRQKIKEMGLDTTYFSHLWGKNKKLHAYGRYILPENKDKIFTLVELDTGKEYDCITNKTIFIYFNLPIIENDIKYIYELFRKRQSYASICGRVFYLKEDGIPKIKQTHSKNFSKTINEHKQHFKIKRKIYSSLLSRVRAALKRKNKKKLNRTEKLIGCNIDFFLGYLQSQFTTKMTWENHGEWHIDHIIPCNKFDLSNIQDQEKCFNFKNLRPLWATTKIALKNGENNNYIGNLNRLENFN